MQTTNPNFYSMTVKMQRVRVKIGIFGLYYHPSNPFLFCGFFQWSLFSFQNFSNFNYTNYMHACLVYKSKQKLCITFTYVIEFAKKDTSNHMGEGYTVYIYYEEHYEADILLTKLLFSRHPFSIWIVRVGKKICVEDHDYCNVFIGKM